MVLTLQCGANSSLLSVSLSRTILMDFRKNPPLSLNAVTEDQAGAAVVSTGRFIHDNLTLKPHQVRCWVQKCRSVCVFQTESLMFQCCC